MVKRRTSYLALLALLACNGEVPVEPDHGTLQFLIADGATSGRSGFFFLPPMVPNPGVSGNFDAGLSPEARVCVLQNPARTACSSAPSIATITTGGPGSNTITVDVAGQSYNAVWKTPTTLSTSSSSSSNTRYRLEVFQTVGGNPVTLGFADLWVVSKTKQLKNAPAGFVGLVVGSSFQIKFRIQTTAIGVVSVTPGTATIGTGQTQQFTASAVNLHNAAVSGASFTWASNNTAVATVNGSGLATAVSTGTASIAATTGGVTGSAALTVSNPAPTAVADNYSTGVNTTLSRSTSDADDLLDNDTRGTPAATLTSFGGGTLGGTVTSNAAGASVALAGGTLTVNSDGSFTLATPTVAGTFTFNYRLANLSGTSDALVTIDVRQAPSAVADNYSTLVNTTISRSTSDADDLLDNDNLGSPAATLTTFGGGSLGGTVTTNAAGASVALAGGTLQVNGNGSFSLSTPTVTGSFTFQYRLTNTFGTSDAQATIEVRRAPTAVADNYSTPVNTTLSRSTADPSDLLDNDTRGFPLATITSFGGGSLGGTVTSNAAGASVALAGGTLTVNGDGSFSLTTPTTTGSFSFQYRLTNAAGTSDATVTIQVQGPPDAIDDGPTSTSVPGNAFHTAFNTTLNSSTDANTPSLLANDNLGSPAGTLASFGGGSVGGTVTSNAAGATVTFGTGGSLQALATGEFVFTPSTGFTGLFTFQYRLTNGSGSDDATATIAVGVRPSGTADVGSTVGNVQLSSSPASVLTNDAGSQLTVTSFSATSTNGGSVSVNASGTYTYNPPAGFSGSDAFTYSAGNGFGSTSAITVTITVGQVVWFINNAVAGPGDGRFTSPFSSVANFNSLAADDPGDYIFVYQGASAYSGGFTLLNTQQLIGHGVGLSISPNLAIAAGSRPTIASVALASGNTVRGLNVSVTTGTAISGASVGALTVNNASVTNTGGLGVSLAGGNSSMAVAFDAVNASGGANGIVLTNNGGSFTVSSGTIDPTTGHGIQFSNTGVGPLNVTLQNMTITGAPAGFNGINFDVPSGGGGSFGTVNISSNTISNNGGTGVRANIQGTGSMSAITVSACTFTGNDSGVDLGTNGTAVLNFDIKDNATMSGTRTQVKIAASDVLANNGTGPQMQGRVTNNVITTSATGNVYIGMWIVADGDGSIIVDVNSNTVNSFGESGIAVESRGGSGRVDATIRNNTVSTSATLPLTGIFLRSGNGTTGETSKLYVNLTSNNANAGAAAVADYYLDRFTPASTTFAIQGLSPSPATPAQAEAFVISTDAAPPATALAQTGSYIAGTASVPTLP